MRTSRTLPGLVTSGLVALLVVLVGAGCAPLEPKSKKAEGRVDSVGLALGTSLEPDAESFGQAERAPRAGEAQRQGAQVQGAHALPRPGRGRGRQLAAVPQGHGHPAEAHPGPADAASLREVRDPRPHQRAGFTPNPCLASQVQWVKSRRLLAAAYAVNSYPNDQTLAAIRPGGPVRRRQQARRAEQRRLPAGEVQPGHDEARRAADPDHLARRRAGADLRVELGHLGQRSGGARRRPRVHRRRLPHRRLLHAGAVGHGRRRPAARHPRVARGRPDLPRRGAAPVRGRPDVPGRQARARPVGARTAAT